MKMNSNLVVLSIVSLLFAGNLAFPFEALSDVFWGVNHYALSVPLFITAILAGVFIRNYLVTVSLATGLLCAASMGMLANDSWGVLTTFLFSIYILFICVASVTNLFAKVVLWICNKEELSTIIKQHIGVIKQTIPIKEQSQDTKVKKLHLTILICSSYFLISGCAPKNNSSSASSNYVSEDCRFAKGIYQMCYGSCLGTTPGTFLQAASKCGYSCTSESRQMARVCR